MGEIEVKGFAERKVPYDVISLYITFCDKSMDAANASQKVLLECEKFLDILEKDGININNIKIVEDSVNRNGFSDEIQYDAIRKIKMEFGFDMEIVNHIRQILMIEKMHIEIYTEYEVSNLSEIHKELMKMAMIDSKNKAETLAEVLGQRVVGIINASKDGIKDNSATIFENVARCEMPMFLAKSDKLQADTTTEIEEITVKWKVE